jgi:hypothetical protein
MRVLPLAVLFATAAFLGVLVSFDTSAQVIDSDPCQQACYEQQSSCVSACGTHTDTVECEGRCEDQLEDCVRHCR